MASDDQLWYRLGYMFERTRDRPAEAGAALSELVDRVKDRVPVRKAGKKRKGARRPRLAPAEQLMAAGLTTVAARLLAAWHPRRDSGVGDLLRGALTGAGAALLVELARPLLRGEGVRPTIDGKTLDHLVTGVAQGLVYASVVEPRVPGPDPFRGAVYGVAEYAAMPFGGLSRVFGRATPQGRIPAVGRILDGLDRRDRAFLEHLAFGVVMGLLYGLGRDSNGIADDDDA